LLLLLLLLRCNGHGHVRLLLHQLLLRLLHASNCCSINCCIHAAT
jgi:hypothetical protein